jgi:hypothetical protein
VNELLSEAFRQTELGVPIFLLFSVNNSKQFHGIAQMISDLDSDAIYDGWSGGK